MFQHAVKFLNVALVALILGLAIRHDAIAVIARMFALVFFVRFLVALLRSEPPAVWPRRDR